MPYLGKSPQHGNYSKLDDFSGDFDGSDATHAIASNGTAITPVRPEALIISINGVIQEPTTDYTVSGTNITFTTAPTAGDNFFGVAMGEQLQIGTPSDATITSAKLSGNLVTPGTLDVNGQELILDADADTTITADTDDTIDIKIAGADDFQFTANTFTAKSGSTITTPTLGVITAHDLGAGIHVRTSDTGGSVSANSDELVLEGDGNAGLTLLSKNDSVGQISFGDGDAQQPGIIQYAHGTDAMEFSAGNAKRAQFNSGGQFQINETANANMTIGLTINQGANDDYLFQLKSSDMAHNMTSQMEADSFFGIQKVSGTAGGALIQSFTESDGRGLFLICGHNSAMNTTKSTSGYGGFDVNSNTQTGTNYTTAGTDANLMSIGTNGGTQHIFDREGTYHANQGSTTFDAWDDAHLARSYDLATGKNTIDSKFDKFISYNHEKLAELKLVGREEDGTPNNFVNITGMQRLHNGAIWQQYEKHENLLNAVYELAVKTIGKDEADEILDKNEIKLLSKNMLLN